jgi:enoyl reductase-like protein
MALQTPLLQSQSRPPNHEQLRIWLTSLTLWHSDHHNRRLDIANYAEGSRAAFVQELDRVLEPIIGTLDGLRKALAGVEAR